MCREPTPAILCVRCDVVRLFVVSVVPLTGSRWRRADLRLSLALPESLSWLQIIYCATTEPGLNRLHFTKSVMCGCFRVCRIVRLRPVASAGVRLRLTAGVRQVV